MDYFFYNTDANAIIEQPRPRFPVLITKGFAAVGGDRRRFGEQLDQLEKDDVLLMYENGVGVVAIGEVQERWDGESHKEAVYYTVAEMEQLTGGAYEYRIPVDWFLDLSNSPVSVVELRKYLGYTPRGTVKRIVAHRSQVTRLISKLLDLRSILPEEISVPSLYVEGASHLVSVNAYERNPEARRRCIGHYGAKCSICGFSFGEVYGPEIEGYIHVHHVKPLAQIGEEYEVDPIADLRPVCPNCHSVLHFRGDSRTIEEVQQLLGIEKGPIQS